MFGLKRTKEVTVNDGMYPIRLEKKDIIMLMGLLETLRMTGPGEEEATMLVNAISPQLWYKR